MSEPLAYFITFTTYGTWLHGRDPGSVDREHNTPGTSFLPPQSDVEQTQRKRMRQSEYRLDAARRGGVLRTGREAARHRTWKLWSVRVRTQHVHLGASAAARPG